MAQLSTIAAVTKAARANIGKIVATTQHTKTSFIVFMGNRIFPKKSPDCPQCTDMTRIGSGRKEKKPGTAENHSSVMKDFAMFDILKKSRNHAVEIQKRGPNLGPRNLHKKCAHPNG